MTHKLIVLTCFLYFFLKTKITYFTLSVIVFIRDTSQGQCLHVNTCLDPHLFLWPISKFSRMTQTISNLEKQPNSVVSKTILPCLPYPFVLLLTVTK